MKEQTAPYRSFMLRVWRSGAGEGTCWRASLEDPRTGERHGFASLSEAFHYLEAQIQPTDDEPAKSNNSASHG